jgi:hypothetical protein
MADAGGFDSDQNVMRPGLGDGDLMKFERLALLNQTDGFHRREG